MLGYSFVQLFNYYVNLLFQIFLAGILLLIGWFLMIIYEAPISFEVISPRITSAYITVIRKRLITEAMHVKLTLSSCSKSQKYR